VPATKGTLGTKGVEPPDDADGSPDGSGSPPPSGATDDDPFGDPQDLPPTDVDDGGSEGLVGAGGSGGDGSGGLLDGLADAYDDAEDFAHETYDDVEEEVAETYDDASKLDRDGEHWGGVAGTPDEVINAGLDFVDPENYLERSNRAMGDAIDDAARDAGDAYRDTSDVIDGIYADSGAPEVVDDVREAGAVVVPDVVEDVYDQGEDLAHQTYGDVVEEVVETYEDASVLDGQGEHWGGLAGTPDKWVEPLVDGAENIAETPGDWYAKSGVDDFGSGSGGGSAGESGVPDIGDFGRGAESDAPDPFALDPALAGRVDEVSELAAEEEAQRVTAEVDDFGTGLEPLDVPDPIEALEPIEAAESIEATEPMEPEPATEAEELIEPG
jgi:hypothetical protein